MGEMQYNTNLRRYTPLYARGGRQGFSAATLREPAFTLQQTNFIKSRRTELAREGRNDWDISCTIARELNGGTYATSTGHSAVYSMIVRLIGNGQLAPNPNPVPGNESDGPFI